MLPRSSSMSDRPRGWSLITFGVLVVSIGFLSHSAARSEDQVVQPNQDAASKRRLQLMQSAVDSFAVTSQQITTESALKFGKAPLLRYNDPTREAGAKTQTTLLLDAGVWRLGESGRPTALLTMEVYPRGEEEALLTYEIVSLSASPFEAPKVRQWPVSAKYTATRHVIRLAE